MEHITNQRNENVDLLRLISMFFVVCIHYVRWGRLADAGNATPLNFAVGGGIAVACNVAVNCFYLISGYFCRGEISFESCRKKIGKIWIPTVIYSVLIPMVLHFAGEITLSGKKMVFLFFPIISNQYWFSTCFIAMITLLPFLGKCLTQLDQKMLLCLAGILVFWDCIQPMFGTNAFSNTGFGILHAVTMYVIGYTIKRMQFKLKGIYCILVFIGCVCVIAGITILSIRLTGDRNRTIADYNSILVVIQSVAFFLFFQNLKIKKIHFSKLAPYVFGIYLLNDNQHARNFLWQKVFHCSAFYDNALLPVHFIMTTLIFFIAALMIEFIRINTWRLLKTRLKRK